MVLRSRTTSTTGGLLVGPSTCGSVEPVSPMITCRSSPAEASTGSACAKASISGMINSGFVEVQDHYAHATIQPGYVQGPGRRRSRRAVERRRIPVRGEWVVRSTAGQHDTILCGGVRRTRQVTTEGQAWSSSGLLPEARMKPP